jgi:hypothetical protein
MYKEVLVVIEWLVSYIGFVEALKSLKLIF